LVGCIEAAFSPDLLARRPSYDERRGAKPPNNWDQNVATVDEMKSRWVYSELGSPRWGEAYAQLRGHTPLLEKARLHVPFSSLTAEERDQLLEYAPHSSRRGLMARLNNHSQYRLEHWTKSQISATRTIHAYDSVPYEDFLAGSSKPGDENSDAREAAKKLPYYPATWEAGMVVGTPGDYILLDGYTRSVVFMKEAPRGDKFAIWVPDE
jgi:hypothetical protein